MYYWTFRVKASHLIIIKEDKQLGENFCECYVNTALILVCDSLIMLHVATTQLQVLSYATINCHT